MAQPRREAMLKDINGIGCTEAWKAVMQRDRALDGRFVFAVSSTGVYCRPSCPSRRPRRENVTFFSTPKAAQEAGYRACQRCEPDAPGGTMAQRAVEAAMRYLDEHVDEPVTLEALAGRIGFSKFHLQRMFRKMVSCSPKEYQDARRIERFKTAAKAGKSVADATYAAGFGSSRALYERAGDHLGMTPGQYRRGGERTRIAYATAASPAGRVLVAGTERGLCAVFLGESDQELLRHLRDEFPRAELAHDDGEDVTRWLTDVLTGVRGEPCTNNTPLDLRGTEFQMRVWRALQGIPRGVTRTYSEIAKQIGAPQAVRAVANACASNRVAVLVPCHRVVRKGGDLGGYRWGVARKRAMLTAEAEPPAGE